MFPVLGKSLLRLKMRENSEQWIRISKIMDKLDLKDLVDTKSSTEFIVPNKEDEAKIGRDFITQV